MEAVKEKDNYIMHAKYDEHFKLLTDSELGRLIRDVNKIGRASCRERV